MFIILICFIILIIICEIFYSKMLRGTHEQKLSTLMHQEAFLKENFKTLELRFRQFETMLVETFFMYELAGKISGVLDKERVLTIFKDEMRDVEFVEQVEFFNEPREGFSNMKLKTIPPSFLGVKARSVQIEENLQAIVKILNLCLDKISLYQRLQAISIHDPLTKVYNRRYFMLRFFEEFERAKRFKLNLSILMADIDLFKKINDRYGHLVGDVVLVEIAKIIKENIREIDFVARYGGEEFVVILQETDRDGALFLAERIINKVNSQMIEAFDERLKLTLSIGVSFFPKDATSADSLLEVADKALYKAKAEGRNRVVFFDKS